MRLGIFAKTFARPSLEETLDAVRAHGLDATQFNMSVAGLPTMPDSIPAELADARAAPLARAAWRWPRSRARSTWPTRTRRCARPACVGCEVLAAACPALGTAVITLCTGTRDRENMWRRHPDNETPEAWQEMRATMIDALAIAERHDVVLAFEPEISNVVDSRRRRAAAAGRAALAAAAGGHRRREPLRRRRPVGSLPNSGAVLTEAFELLGGDIVLAHAKDVTENGSFAAAGQGDVDWEHYLALLDASGYTGALIMHGLEEADVADSTAFLSGLLNARA